MTVSSKLTITGGVRLHETRYDWKLVYLSSEHSRQSTLSLSQSQSCNSEQAINCQLHHTVHNLLKCVNTDSGSDLLIMLATLIAM